jgi:3-deoxy-D-manno-octulosonic-acid transferase
MLDGHAVSRLVHRIYSGLMRCAQPLLRRKMAKRALQEPAYGEAVVERFGDYTQPHEIASELVWIHAVSLGETRTAAILVKALREHYPGLRLLLTHGTATGRAEGKSLLQPGDVQVWQPWDTDAVVTRFFEHFKPRLGLLMETEVWPCLVASANARKVPLLLINGRLSEKSLQEALRLSPLALPAYAALTAVYAQTEADAKRYQKLGATVAGVFGNLKFDAAPSASQQAIGKAWRKGLNHPVLMFASSREGEEALFLQEIMSLAQQKNALKATDSVAIRPSRKWLLVPRHPQRFDEVAALVGQYGLTVSRRSTWQNSPLDNDEAMAADVWLGDSLGEMALYYALSDAALLGGSFEKLGGQNLIEAAACGCPVVMGLHTFNFSEAADLAQAAGAAIRVSHIPEALRSALDLLASPLAHQRAVTDSLTFVASHSGATRQTLLALEVFLKR